MRICPVKAMTSLLAITALLTLDASTLSVLAGLLPVALVAALAFGRGPASLEHAIRWLRRRLRAARRPVALPRRWVTASPAFASRAVAGAHRTRGPPA